MTCGMNTVYVSDGKYICAVCKKEMPSGWPTAAKLGAPNEFKRVANRAQQAAAANIGKRYAP